MAHRDGRSHVHHKHQHQSVKMPGSTVRQCPHCRNKMNCRNRCCVKCGKLLDFKHRQSVRLAKFRAQARQWAKTTIKSRNQSKVLDNVNVMMEKLKALGYVPLLFLGKFSKAQKWTAEHILQGLTPEKEQEVTEHNEAESQDLTETVEEEEDIISENNVEVERLEDEEQINKQQIESRKEEPERPVEEERDKSPEKEQEVIKSDEKERQDLKETVEDEENIVVEDNVEVRRLENEEQIEEQQIEGREEEPERPVEEERDKVTKKTEQAKGVKKQTEKRKFNALEMEAMEERREMEGVILKADWRRLRKGRKEVLVHWLPCPSCKKTWPPTWEPEDNVQITLSQC
ncbi:hypothetical protein G5714_005904 [Onychostoma macrolepis]|uniref:Chromo domain-containing protein n=1 Tax=Onychostoma macrolepis TaxID=369639 RepID=A0A7J6D2C6_9TELE|nr:hypothetical protein G5714_005904 [Onychostoma macrolepis]